MISYGRYDIPIDQIERAGYDVTTSTLLIKFSFRTKPKHFTLESPSVCKSVCELLSTLLNEIDRSCEPSTSGTRASAASYPSAGSSPSVIDPDARARLRRKQGHSPVSPATRTIPPPPEWLMDWLESNGASREWALDTYAKARSGHCCRRYALEAILFGVFMPLATAGYWLADASARERHSSFSNHWLPAACELHNPLVVSRQVYHHGKYADAKDLAYQEGRVWRLEPAFNTSVKLYLEYGSRYAFSARGWPSTWWATVLTSVVEEERPHCDGQVMDSTEETRARCDETPWLPDELLRLNGTQPCFVDRKNRNHVFLNIENPGGLFLDVFTIIVCFALAATFAFCLVREHHHTIKAYFAYYCGRKRGGSADAAGASSRCGHTRSVSNGSGSGHSRNPSDGASMPRKSMLTPENVKTAYEQVRKGFTEMV